MNPFRRLCLSPFLYPISRKGQNGFPRDINRCTVIHLAPVGTVAVPTMSKNIVNNQQEFREVLPELLSEITKLDRKFADVKSVEPWLEKVLKYNLAGGKNNRGVSTLIAYKMLEKPEKLTSDSVKLACKMGWCVEMFQSYFLVLDDIMDGSVTRRGVPCWFRQPDVGLSAINDAILIQCSVQQTMRRNFGEKPYYTQLLDLFNETLFQTSIGQFMDLSTSHDSKTNLTNYTMERYRAIVKYKTAYYTYLLPVRLALYMAGISEPKYHALVEEICLEIGVFFQIQDDYLDCFGDSSVTGKVGTDIQEGKCSWPAVTALQRCNDRQFETMKQCYGSKAPEDVAKIVDIYKELKIQETYLVYEEVTYNNLRDKIDSLPVELNHELFLRLLEQIYKRKS